MSDSSDDEPASQEPVVIQAKKVTTPGSKAPQAERPGRPQPGKRSILDVEQGTSKPEVAHAELHDSSGDEDEQFVELQKAKGAIYAIKEWEKSRALKEGRPADVSSY